MYCVYIYTIHACIYTCYTYMYILYIYKQFLLLFTFLLTWYIYLSFRSFLYIYIVITYIYVYIYILYIYIYIYYFRINRLNSHSNSFMLSENYIPLAMAYIYTRFLFGQAFLELNSFSISCLPFLDCQAHEMSQDLASLFSSSVCTIQKLIRRCSAKRRFLKILRNSQEIISARI